MWSFFIESREIRYVLDGAILKAFSFLGVYKVRGIVGEMVVERLCFFRNFAG